MTANLAFFPVGNGDMTLIKLESGLAILIDVNIREAADDPDDPAPNVATMLRKRLVRDTQGRLYVDAFLLSHPDQDHCRGLTKHFHLGAPDEYNQDEDKIFIREIWSSPMVFRRASKVAPLCDDAKEFNKEARRRVQRYRDSGVAAGDGDRIQILGRDENGKTDGLENILVETDALVTKINGAYDGTMTARLLAPLPKGDDEDEEDVLTKNRSSTILRFSLMGEQRLDASLFLTGGDAEVAIWERLEQKHRYTDWLLYDLLLTPHHCSWHSLSYDSWSEMGEEAKVNPGARWALSQARPGATLVASSEPIKDDDSDPPCIRAKKEYEDIAREARGEFMCTDEYPSEMNPDALEFEVGGQGPRRKTKLMKAAAIIGAGGLGGQPLPHG